ncbi:MAG: T9SS type A sorting domain-containing protein [Bacteroidia bacterium]|nr:T9SS type A sorting domain-containing protein [Bacteroidia bacterium]NNF31188.1 T9SS type A sorting domain-containing protein [Flavobacteriaceae bacterium]MBT8274820.1 T9SS type A sorting domain-containing protein [Bacteroidia bacterium]NNJ80633.1 T9SS type A sorting domain-containing protein [Flavobacteriaceae bacterium]NNK54618.1 T9SS type A sorting domain-containing protein [Flavobacteriaceae bacterium]
MKKYLLTMAVMATLTISAQTTFDITWEIGVNGAPASPTVETGDTVRWTWGDALPHSVTSLAGSQQTFDSTILTGMGTEFSFTFTEVGTNDYQCDVHPGSMFGTVTVEEVLSVEDKFVKSLSFYPNPAKDQLNIFSLFRIDSYALYNVAGQRVMHNTDDGNFSTLEVSSLQPGIYFVRVTSGDMSHTNKVIIQ